MAGKNKKKKRPTPPPAPVRTKAPRAASAPAGPTRKQQQQAARQAAARRENVGRWVATAALIGVVVLVVGGYLLYDNRRDADLRDALTSGSCQVDTETDPTRAAGQNHITNPSYSVNPPAGGDHLAAPGRGGVYAGTSVPNDGALVHSLEHGYIVVWHRPDLPAAARTQLADFEREHDGDVIVVERASNPVPVAATAWGHRLLCQEVEPAVLERFFDERVGDGPEDVGRG